jgi:hypothetical protein
VSPTGSDASAGTLAAPFKTLTRAQQAVRASIASGMTGDVNVYLRGGMYPLSSTLALTQADSGRNGHRAIWRAYGNEQPVLSGGTVLAGVWVHTGNDIWYLPGVTGAFRQLYVNDTWATRARQPNTGYHRLVSYDITGQRIQIDQAHYSTAWTNQAQIEMVVQSHWRVSNLRLAGYSDGYVTSREPERSLFFTTLTPTLVDGQPYHWENALAFVDTQGEWYHDLSSSRLYYKAAMGQNPNSMTFVAPRLEKLVTISGSAASYARDIDFIGLTFAHTTWLYPSANGYVQRQAMHHCWGVMPGAVDAQFVSGLRFQSNTFRLLGGAGLTFYQGTRDNLVSCNLFEYIAGTGIGLETRAERDALPAEQARDDTISDNTIRRIGLGYPGHVGIFAGYPNGATIMHNSLSNMPYTGISVGWGWTLDATPLGNNEIAYNDIGNVMQLLDDGGGIYTLSSQPGTTIHHNYIHDIVRSAWASDYSIGGLYLDNGSDYMTVRDNAVHIDTTQYRVWTLLISSYKRGEHNNTGNNTSAPAANVGVRLCGDPIPVPEPAAAGIGACHWASTGLPDDIGWAYDTTTPVHWRTLEPAPGSYDFAPMDALVRAHVGSGRRLWLSVQTVGYGVDGQPKAPAWVSGMGARWLTGSCSKDGMFTPWDGIYQQRLSLLLQAVNDHIAQQDAAYRQTLGGIVMMSGGMYGETQLWSCNMETTLKAAYGLTDAQLNNQYVAATRAIVDIYADAMPDMPLMLQVGRTQTDAALVTYAKQRIGPRLHVKWNGLDPTNQGDGFDHIRESNNCWYQALFGLHCTDIACGYELGHPQTWWSALQWTNLWDWTLQSQVRFLCIQPAFIPTARTMPGYGTVDETLEGR